MNVVKQGMGHGDLTLDAYSQVRQSYFLLLINYAYLWLSC